MMKTLRTIDSEKEDINVELHFERNDFCSFNEINLLNCAKWFYRVLSSLVTPSESLLGIVSIVFQHEKKYSCFKFNG